MTKRSSLPSKLGKPLWSNTMCMNKHTFCLSSAKCWFFLLVPIVKCAHCWHYDLACLFVANNTNTRDCIVGYGHILQWDLMSKINILRSWDKLCVYNFIHTRSSAPNMFAKFGWKTWTFCHKKVAKVIDNSGTHFYSRVVSTILGRTRIVSELSSCCWRNDAIN